MRMSLFSINFCWTQLSRNSVSQSQQVNPDQLKYNQISLSAYPLFSALIFFCYIEDPDSIKIGSATLEESEIQPEQFHIYEERERDLKTLGKVRIKSPRGALFMEYLDILIRFRPDIQRDEFCGYRIIRYNPIITYHIISRMQNIFSLSEQMQSRILYLLRVF